MEKAILKRALMYLRDKKIQINEKSLTSAYLSTKEIVKEKKLKDEKEILNIKDEEIEEKDKKIREKLEKGVIIVDTTNIIDTLYNLAEKQQDLLKETDEVLKNVDDEINKDQKDISVLKKVFEKYREKIKELRNKNSKLLFELKKLREELKKIKNDLEKVKKKANIDFLTNVYNKGSILRALKDAFNLYKKYKIRFCIILVDVDHFKSINDTYGHLAGDKVLKMVAFVLKTNLRAKDIIGRYGGEEFLIILNDIEMYKAVEIAERLRKEIEKNVKIGDRVITASFGVSCVKENDTIESLIERADKALYLAKRSGRNQVKTCLDLMVEGNENHKG